MVNAEKQFGTGSFQSCSNETCGSEWEGDLKLQKYCYSEISVSECVDTDGGKNYTQKGSIAGYVDTCSPFDDQILQEYYPDTSSGKCEAKSENHTCDGLCEDGRCLPPTCDDLIQNQGEQGVDCGDPCPDTCTCPSGCSCMSATEAESSFGQGAFQSCSDTACGSGWSGDLNISKYCYKKIGAGDCVDTDGGANVNVKGSAPGCEDHCSPFDEQTLNECTVIDNINSCKVTESIHECDGICEDGRCLPPTCEDLVQNQSESGVDCGGPCPKCVECTWCGNNITPIRLRGTPNSGMIDIVFVPDKTYKGGELDFDRFVFVGKDHIRNGYFQMDTWATGPLPNNYKDRFNFYYYTGGYGDVGGDNGCAGKLPDNFWSNDHADFADAGGILRDVEGAAGCATGGPPGHFQARLNTNVVVHETGHVIFGLSDEYCGCRGGHWQGSQAPNLWSSESACEDDATNAGWTLGDCREICDVMQAEQGPDLSTCPDKNLDWWRYDDDPDMMGSGSGTIGEACTRRINHVFNNWPSSASNGILVWLKIKDGKITEVSSEITDAHPDTGMQSGHFNIEILSGDDGILESFELWDPRIQASVGIEEEATYQDEALFPVRFAWKENLKTVKMYNKASKELVATVDLEDTITDFCKKNIDEPDCQATKYIDMAQLEKEAIKSDNIKKISVAVGVFLILLVGYFAFGKRKS